MWNEESKEEERDTEMQEMSHKQPKLQHIKTEEITKDSP